MFETYLLITNIILIVSLMILIIAYSPILKRLYRHESREHKEQDQALSEAEKIIHQAEQNASDQISSANIFSQDLKNEYRRSLERLNKDLLQAYEEDQINWLKSNKESLVSLSDQVEQSAQEYLKSFQENLIAESKKAISQVNEQILSEATKVQEDLNNYKQNYIQRMDHLASKVVKETIKRSLGKTLTPEDHTQIIIDAINKAQIENGK